MVKPVFLNLYLVINAKTAQKAERIPQSIQPAFNSTLYISEIFSTKKNEYTDQCHLIMENHVLNSSVIDSLNILKKIGKERVIKAPIIGDEYWVFMGKRNLSQGNFTIDGLREVSFALTKNQYDRLVDRILTD